MRKITSFGKVGRIVLVQAVFGVVVVCAMANSASATLLARYQFEDNLQDSTGNNVDGDYGTWTTPGTSGGPAGVFTGSGTPTYDGSAPAYTGAGKAISLMGDADAIDLGSSSLLNPSAAMTAAAWIKLIVQNDSDLDVNHFLFTRAATWTGGVNSWASWANRPGSTVPGRFWGPAGISQASNSGDVWDGSWHHLAITTNTTDNGGDGQTRIYVDGSVATVGDTIPSIDQVVQNTFLGSDGGGLFTNYHGFMDDVVFFDTALSQGEIADLMTGIVPEPTVFVLLLSGLAPLSMMARRRRR